MEVMILYKSDFKKWSHFRKLKTFQQSKDIFQSEYSLFKRLFKRVASELM